MLARLPLPPCPSIVRHNQAVAVLAAGLEQVEIEDQGRVVVAGAPAEMVSALTRTGMTCPVLRENVRCLRTMFH